MLNVINMDIMVFIGSVVFIGFDGFKCIRPITCHYIHVFRKGLRPVKAGRWFVDGDDLTGALYDL